MIPTTSTANAPFIDVIAPHLKVPLLAKASAVTSETAAAYAKEFKKLTPAEWHTNNRWLYVQPLSTQLHVLLCLTRYSLPLISIDTHLLARVVFEYMDRPDELMAGLSQAEQEEEYVFELPSGIYGLLIERLSAPDVDDGTTKRVVETILKNVVRLITGERPYFSRTHIITLYEKLRSLFIATTLPGGSIKFVHLVETVAGLAKHRSASSATTSHNGSAYRMKCLQTVHHTLLASTFRTLACRAHYEDLDVLFHYCRQALRGSLLHWLSQLKPDEVDDIWIRCPHIKAYCQVGAFRMRTNFHPQSAIALKCASLMSPDEHLLVEGSSSGSAIELLHSLSTEGTPKSLWTWLQRYPVQTRRTLVHRLMDELVAAEQAAKGGTAEDAVPVAYANAQAVFATYARQVVKLMHIKKDGLQHTIQFYTQHLKWSIQTLFATQKWTDITSSRLKQWLVAMTPVPLNILAEFVTAMVYSIQRQPPSQGGTLFTFRTFQRVQECESKIQCLLAQPLSHVRDVVTVRQMLKDIGGIVASHMQAFQMHRYQRVRHLVRCLLLLEHVLLCPEVTDTSTHGTTGTPGECAVCYNEVQGTLHTLQCGHSFHPECVLQLAQFSTHTRHALPFLAKCPYCMAEIQPKAEVHNLVHTASPPMPEWRMALHYYVYTI